MSELLRANKGLEIYFVLENSDVDKCVLVQSSPHSERRLDQG